MHGESPWTVSQPDPVAPGSEVKAFDMAKGAVEALLRDQALQSYACVFVEYAKGMDSHAVLH